MIQTIVTSSVVKFEYILKFSKLNIFSCGLEYLFHIKLISFFIFRHFSRLTNSWANAQVIFRQSKNCTFIHTSLLNMFVMVLIIALALFLLDRKRAWSPYKSTVSEILIQHFNVRANSPSEITLLDEDFRKYIFKVTFRTNVLT